MYWLAEHHQHNRALRSGVFGIQYQHVFSMCTCFYALGIEFIVFLFFLWISFFVFPGRFYFIPFSFFSVAFAIVHFTFSTLNEKQIRACSKSDISSMWIRYYKLSNAIMYRNVYIYYIYIYVCMCVWAVWSQTIGSKRKKLFFDLNVCVCVCFALCNNWEKRTLHHSTKV